MPKRIIKKIKEEGALRFTDNGYVTPLHNITYVRLPSELRQGFTNQYIDQRYIIY